MITDSKDFKQFYDDEYYLKKVEGHKEFLTGELHLKKKYLIDLINAEEKRILDIGFGRGEMLQECFKRGASLYVGIDYSEVALRIAKKHCRE